MMAADWLRTEHHDRLRAQISEMGEELPGVAILAEVLVLLAD